jgi:enoyl-CoA hydratase
MVEAHPVRIEWDGDIAVVTLDRPHRRNAVDHATLVALRDVQREVAARRIRVLVLTGAPPAFCAGADLTGVEGGEFARLLGEVLQGFTELACVTLAAVDGPALGAGTQLAIACDLRMATGTSPFGIPAVKLGLAVDQWTVDRLREQLGGAIARNMLLAGATYAAGDLVACGFVHRIGGLDTAIHWAHDLAALAPLSIRAHKLGLEAGGSAFEQAREAAWASGDADEGRQAFLEKRPPRFSGR